MPVAGRREGGVRHCNVLPVHFGRPGRRHGHVLLLHPAAALDHGHYRVDLHSGRAGSAGLRYVCDALRAALWPAKAGAG